MSKIQDLVNVEWFILKKYKPFWINILCGFLMSASIPLLFKYIDFGTNNRFERIFINAFDFPLIINTISVISLYSIHFYSFLIIIYVCEEFENKTYKLFLLNNYSRNDLWIRKQILIILLCLTQLLLILILSFLIGSDSLRNFSSISLKWGGIFLIQSFFYLNTAMLIAAYIKKTGTSILIYILYFLILDRIVGHFIDFPFKLYPLGSLMPGKVIEELSYLKSGSNILIVHHGYFELRIIFSVLWVLFVLYLSNKKYNHL
jgi:hypothetical protein